MVTLLNHGVKFYGIKENIASKVGNFKNHKAIAPNVNFWTFEEYQKFIEKVDNYMYQVLFDTLYYTGLRLGECLALSWKDLTDNYIVVNITISKEKINGVRLITSPKTKSSIRKVMIDPDLKQKLLNYKKYCSKTIHFEDNWFIFGGINPLSPTTIERKKNKYCEEADIKKIRIHDLRHSHASLLISNGVPITVVQNRLGHSDSSMTLKIYSHMFPSDEDKAIKVINTINALRGY